MPKVVGKDPAFVKRKTCRNCSSIVEYTDSERKQGKTSDWTGDSEYYYYIDCPCCTKRIQVK